MHYQYPPLSVKDYTAKTMYLMVTMTVHVIYSVLQVKEQTGIVLPVLTFVLLDLIKNPYIQMAGVNASLVKWKMVPHAVIHSRHMANGPLLTLATGHAGTTQPVGLKEPGIQNQETHVHNAPAYQTFMPGGGPAMAAGGSAPAPVQKEVAILALSVIAAIPDHATMGNFGLRRPVSAYQQVEGIRGIMGIMEIMGIMGTMVGVQAAIQTLNNNDVLPIKVSAGKIIDASLKTPHAKARD